MTVKTQGLTWRKNGKDFPFVAKRIFQLTLDDPGATKNETFWGIQVAYTSAQTSPPKILVLSGDSSGTVNPVYAGLNGGVYGAPGIGIVSSGVDCHGTEHTASEGVEVNGWGGDTTEADVIGFTN